MAKFFISNTSERSPLISSNLNSVDITDYESVNSFNESEEEEHDNDYDHEEIEGEDQSSEEYNRNGRGNRSAFDYDYEGESDELSSDKYHSHLHKKDSWRQVAYLAFSSLGAIYGDIGTSPLYVLNTIKFRDYPPKETEIYGAVSVIFYLFTIIVMIKYLMIVLVIGPNNGEGGQVAIYAKIARHLEIGPKGVKIPGGPETDKDDDNLILTRQFTSQSFIINAMGMKNSALILNFLSKLILGGCFIGCSLVMADGLLTPTTSVLSAIQGIQVAKPDFQNVLLVSEIVLVCLFVMQQFGSAKVSILFAPIIFVWLLGLLFSGAYNIISFHPGIIKALSPVYAYNSLMNGGIDVFSGAMLAITGTEAMFADIGHFGKLPVQLALTLLVYPALMICYLGQGAYLIHNPEAMANPFFMSIPGGLNSTSYWIMFVLATFSTIIASQALILGCFSIIAQLINLDCFPKFKIVHVDKDHIGKVYIPAINWLLMIGVLATTAGFGTSDNVTAAYGLGISLDFLVTSVLIIICMIYVYDMHTVLPIVFGLVFIPLELIMISANVKKIESGAWFTILMASIFISFLYFWSWARTLKVTQEFAARVKIGDLFPDFRRTPQNQNEVLDLSNKGGKGKNFGSTDWEERGRERHAFRFEEELTVEYDISSRRYHSIPPARSTKELRINSFTGAHTLKTYDGVGIMYTEALHTLNSPNTVPQLYREMIESFTCIPSVFIFCAIKILSIPVIEDEKERILIGSMKIPGHYRCIVRFGFAEEVQIQNDIISRIINTIPETPFLVRRFNKFGVLSNTESVPILHIFENELVRSHKFEDDDQQGVDSFVRVGKYIRNVLINDIFSPINNAFRAKDQFLEIDDEHMDNQKRLFIGSIVRL